MKEIEPGYKENFEDVLRDAHLEGKNCQIFLVGGINIAGRIKAVDANVVQLECDKGVISFVRPQSIIALFTQGGALPQQPGCPWCGR